MPNAIQIQQYLQGVDYPVDKQQLIQKAKENGAPQEVCDMIENAPMEQFQKPTDVSQAMLQQG